MEDLNGTIGLLYSGGGSRLSSYELEIDPELVITTPKRVLLIDCYISEKHIGNKPWQYKNANQAQHGNVIEISWKGLVEAEYYRAGRLVVYLHKVHGLPANDSRKLVSKMGRCNTAGFTLEGKCNDGDYTAIIRPNGLFPDFEGKELLDFKHKK